MAAGPGEGEGTNRSGKCRKTRHLEDRLPTLAARSIETEKERLKPLGKYFGEIPLNRISVEAVRLYIVERKKSGVANKTINLELGYCGGC